MICDSSLGMGYPERRIGLAVDRDASPPDGRSGRNVRYAMRDTGSAVFSVFPMRSPSLLPHRRPLSEGRGIPNARTPFGVGRIPCGNRIRRMPHGVPLEHSDGVFSAVIADPGDLGRCRVCGVRTGVRRWHRTVRSNSDPASRTMGNARRAVRAAGRGISTALAASRWSRQTLPLAPEFVHPQEGPGKRHCRSRAAPAGAGRALRGRAAADPFGR